MIKWHQGPWLHNYGPWLHNTGLDYTITGLNYTIRALTTQLQALTTQLRALTTQLSVADLPTSIGSPSGPSTAMFKLYLSLIESPGRLRVQNLLKEQNSLQISRTSCISMWWGFSFTGSWKGTVLYIVCDNINVTLSAGKYLFYLSV